MAVVEKINQEDLIVYEILRNPVLCGEFVQNFDKLDWEEKFEYTYYQVDVLCDFNSYVSICTARATGKCLHKDSKILNPQTGEYRTVEEWFLNNKLSSILSINNAWKQSIDIPHIEPNGIKDCIEIKTVGGYKTVVTEEHPILTNKGFKKASELSIGDYISTAKEIPFFGYSTELTDDEIIIIAHFIAEDTYHCGSITTTSEEVIQDIYNYAKSINHSVRADNITYFVSNNCKNEYLKLLEKMGVRNKHSFDKFIPQEIFKLPKEKLGLFLNRLFGDDGWCIDSDNHIEIGYATTSEQLARDIKHLLLRFGISSSLIFKKNRFKGAWSLSIKGYNNLIRFKENIGFHIKYKNDRLINCIEKSKLFHNQADIIPIPNYSKYTYSKHDTLSNKYYPGHIRYYPSRIKAKDILNKDKEFNKFENADINWVKVTSLVLIKDQETYAIEVEKNHTHLVDDIWSHNTVSLVGIIIWALIFNLFPSPDYILYTVPNKVHLQPVWEGLVRNFRSNGFLKNFINPTSGINGSDYTIKPLNNSLLMCRIAGTTGTGANVIGLHTPFELLDESGYFPHPTFQELQPTLNTFTQGFRFMVAGVPTGLRENNICYMADRENSSYTKHRVSAFQNPRFSEEDEKRAEEQYGGKDSDDYIHLVCFTPDTPIITNDGIVDIEKIKIGDLVLTHKGNWKKVIKTFKRDYCGKLLSIKTEKFYKPIVCTPNHPIYGKKLKKVTWSGNKPYALWKGNLYKNTNPSKIKELLPEFISASEFTNLDKVSFPRIMYNKPLPEYIYFSEFGKVINNNVYKISRARNNKTRLTGKFPKKIMLSDDVLFFLGLFTAEGSNVENRGQCSLAFHLSEQDLVNKCKQVLKKFNLNSWETFSGNGRCLYFQSRIFSEFVSKYLGHGATNKHLPEFLAGCNSKSLLPYLEGLFAGDGSCRERHNKFKASIATVSKELAYQVLYILYGFGIRPELLETPGGKTVLIHKNKKPTITNTVYTIRVGHNEIDSIYNNNINTFNSFDDNTLAIRVKNIEEVNYNGYVYNLEVEDDNSYVTCGFSAHNCGEHGAPVFSVFDRRLFEIGNYPVYKLQINGQELQDNIDEYYKRIIAFPLVSQNKAIIMGIDLGFTEPTAIIILYEDSQGRLKFHGRIQLNKVSYNIQDRLIDLLDTKFKPALIGMDEGSVGKAVRQRLQEADEFVHKNYKKRLIPIDFSSCTILGYNSDGIEIKSKTKPFAVSSLQEYSNNHKIVYTSTDLEMVSELERMTYSKNPAGDITYRTLTPRGGKKGDDHFTSALLCAALAYYLENESLSFGKKSIKLFKTSWFI